MFVVQVGVFAEKHKILPFLEVDFMHQLVGLLRVFGQLHG